ncbi:MAG: hypothetical protein IKT71_06425 [Paludibacteraceae bacterium]|nr:hypothetical protein [Paludibacteraceae bacterium]
MRRNIEKLYVSEKELKKYFLL